MFQRPLVVAVFTTLWAAFAHAEGGEQAAPDKAALQRELQQAFARKDYKTALEKGQALVRLAPDDNAAHYNLACAQARLGRKDDAFASLAKAVEKGYGDAGHMKEDEDLSSLRDDKRFEELAAKAHEAGKRGGWEKGAEIEGVKTIEDLPEGGLRYRVRMSPYATPGKPNRLVVWLHPSGGSMNKTAEGLSKFFNKHGFALLVLTRKQWTGWDGREMNMLVRNTLPEVGKIPGIDAGRPIFMGFSAGGQAALVQWGADPAAVGGLILDAAYPIDLEAFGRGQTKVMPLPGNEAIKKVPMFVLVGDQDGGAKVWKKCEDDWRKAGVPITIEYVAGGRHQWLFGKSQLDTLGKWLEEVAADKLPSDKPAGGSKPPGPEDQNERKDGGSGENGAEKPSGEAKSPNREGRSGSGNAAPERKPEGAGDPAPTPQAAVAAESLLPPKGGWPAKPETGALRLKVEGIDNENAWFLLGVPKPYAPDHAWPLMIVLHGGPGGRPDDLASMFRAGLMQKGAIGVFPMALDSKMLLEWNYPHSGAYLLRILKQLARTYRIDARRIYLVGHSMGGGGAWAEGAVMRDVWAALGPLSGWYKPTPAPPVEWLKDMPIYCLHGKNDAAVPSQRSQLAFDELTQAGIAAKKYTVFTDPKGFGKEQVVYREIQEAGHDIFHPWATLGAKEVGVMVAWMLAQKRERPADLDAAAKALAAWGAKHFQWKPTGSPIGEYSMAEGKSGSAKPSGEKRE